ncbi:hypothetical protein NBRC116590_00230 [Pelagimonas sp. KU-00592-HH]|uniref:GNAT family N-acetyltransferase n=1 Tax=Pelagimonas sp. KU-00592-HH TaxID=3127651 RepID=UPI0031060664
MTQNMAIRGAKVADMEPLLALIRADAKESGQEAEVDANGLWREVFGAQGMATLLVAETRGELTGYAVTEPRLDLFSGQRGVELRYLYVVPGRRTKGVARSLVAAARAQACQNGEGWLSLAKAAG